MVKREKVISVVRDYVGINHKKLHAFLACMSGCGYTLQKKLPTTPNAKEQDDG